MSPCYEISAHRFAASGTAMNPASGRASILGQFAPLIESMIEGVWLVEPLELRIVACNSAAGTLLGMAPAQIIGKPVIELAATPEDIFFWEDVAAGLSDHIFSETLLRRADGETTPVERRVSRVVLGGEHCYLVGLRDQSEELRVEGELERLVAELRATLESTADGILATDLEGSIRGYNRRFAELWQLPEDLLTRRDDGAVHAWMANSVLDIDRYAARLSAITHSPLLEATDILKLRSGKIIERVTLPQYSRGRPTGRVYSFRDITQRLADEARLKLAAKVFSASLDAIFVSDAEWHIITANPACETLTGHKISELIGRPLLETLLDRMVEDRSVQIEEGLCEHGFWQGEVWRRHKSGETHPCLMSIVRVGGENDMPANFVAFFKDLSETLAAKKRIEELAYSDALTGLPNRLLLAQRIEFEISLARRDHSSFALLFLDLDRFKHINDSLGHVFGDRVLLEVAERLKGCLRQVDTAARIGGDEFVLLLHQADPRGAETIARRTMEAIARPFQLDEMNFTLSCSIGIALFPDDGDTLDDLIKNADSAMYHAKERGRAGFRFYQRQMNVDLLSRMKLDQAMRQALRNEAFHLHYQPQLDLAHNRIFGAEALIRWHDEELGDVPPGRFIPVAEETGLIITIGHWVLEQAVAQAARWHAEGRSLSLAINVSALQFQQADFVDTVANALTRHQLPPELLELELTESILIQDAADALRRLQALSALGVRLAIDDFGTGYSSLGYLKRFPLDKLKIDRSFVGDLPKDESDTAIVGAVIQIAHSLGLRAIAEGVETEAQRQFLRQAGCDEYQGFLCSPALPADRFIELTEHWQDTTT